MAPRKPLHSPKDPDPVKGSRRMVVRLAAMFGLLTAGVVVFLWFFPRMGNQVQLVAVAPILQQGQVKVVSLWSETTYSESYGLCLAGFQVQVTDPLAPKATAKLWLPRALDYKPADPVLRVSSRGEIWVVRGTQFLQDTSGELRRITLDAQGQPMAAPLGCLTGFQAASDGDGRYMVVRNRFNEQHCYDFARDVVTEGNCPWDEVSGKQEAFFMVHKSSGSTRGRLWHVSVDAPAPAPEIQVGVVEGDRPLPGTHILSDLEMNRNEMSEERLAYYQSVADSAGLHLRQVSEEAYLENAVLLAQDSVRAVLQLPGATTEQATVVAYNLAGQRSWSADLPPVTPGSYGVKVQRWGALTTVCSTRNWVVAVDEASGKVVWRFVE